MSTSSRSERLLIIFAIFVLLAPPRGPTALSGQAPQSTQPPAQTQAQQRPVFRGGARFVRVDAYPVENGKIVEGLRPQDFEILEDDKPQTIDSLDFIRFDTWTAEAERRDPVSKQAGFDLAADPRYRVFVVYVDLTFTTSMEGVENLPLILQPLVNFVERVMGAKDLYGLMTTRNSVKDLVLAQKTTVTVSEIKDLLRAKFIARDEADEVLDTCPWEPPVIERMKVLYRADANYANLKNLIVQLGSLRQERKNLVLVTNLLPRWGPNRTLYQGLVSSERGGVPKTGIVRGRLTEDNRDIATSGRGGDLGGCMSEAGRLALMDFEPRYRELMNEAKRENVSIYAITPSGLQAPPSPAAIAAMRKAYDDLTLLANETDGLAVTDTNDLNAGFRRIADDLAAYYVLGYYTTNRKVDGGIRKITVKLKGKSIRARRQYRAPTEAELAALTQRSSAAPAAAAASGPPAVIGEPAVYRVSRTQPPERVKLPEFVRSDRIRLEWPVLAALDRREARMLDTVGKPLPFNLPVSEAPDGKTVVVELPLAPFGRGGYSIELTAASGGRTEQRRLTFIVK